MFALTDLGKADNLVDALFGLDLEEEFKCEESGESKISTATAKKLVCNIQGGAGSNTQASRPVFVGGALYMCHGRCRPKYPLLLSVQMDACFVLCACWVTAAQYLGVARSLA